MLLKRKIAVSALSLSTPATPDSKQEVVSASKMNDTLEDIQDQIDDLNKNQRQ